MGKGKETSSDFYRVPRASNKDDWSKYAEEVDHFVNQYAQTGETGYSTFGEDIAARSLQRFLNRTAAMSQMVDLEAPKSLLDINRKMVKDSLNKIGEINHEDIVGLRTMLTKLPASHRHLQNQIFTNLMNEYESTFILETLKPNRMIRKGMDTFPGALMGLNSEQMTWYDFIGKLTELDKDGKPVVSDGSFQNFFEWYQASLAKRQHELNAERSTHVADYSNCLKNAVKNELLPESFAKNLDFFEPDSPRSRNLNFSLFDLMGNGSSASGLYVEYISTDREAPIGLRADIAVSNDIYEVIWHELTHVISGDMIDFGDDEANRIVDEALTEHISHLILLNDVNMFENEEFDFMSGEAYTSERDAVGWLASGGANTVSPKLFYEAYAEYDPEYEKKYDEWLHYMDEDEMPKPKVGPKKEALFSALLKAFPECRDVNDLGKLIVKKFKQRTPQHN